MFCTTPPTPKPTAVFPKILMFPGWYGSGKDRRSGLAISPCSSVCSESRCTTCGLAPKRLTMKAIRMGTRRKESGDDRNSCCFACRARPRRQNSSLFAGRTRQSLDRRIHLYLLSDHGPRVLVAVYVLAGGARWRWTDRTLLASLVRSGVPGV